MYYRDTEGYYDADGTQHARRAPFLILMQCASERRIRGIIRKVALTQLGHFMMGRVRIGRFWYTVSGAYGNDGLPLAVEKDAWQRGTDLPADLYDAWNKGGGWNSAGNERPLMVEWAKKLEGNS